MSRVLYSSESSNDVSMEEDDARDNGSWRSRSAPPATDTPESDPEAEMFDIGLAATHSYLDAGMVSLRGRSVLEAGWQGNVPVVAHHSCVFPGETVPMVLPDPHDAAILAETIKSDRLFGLLCPDETGQQISGYGVLCEVYELGLNGRVQHPSSMAFRARANYRFRVMNMSKLNTSTSNFKRMRHILVKVLPEIVTCDTLRAARLDSLDKLRMPRYTQVEQSIEIRERSRLVRSMEATLTPWPLFLHDMFDYQRMRNTIKEYFRSIMKRKKGNLPVEPVSLSFYVASNLVLSARDRLALFVVDNAMLRLHIECQYVKRNCVLCCSSCLTEISRKEHIFPMSSEGVHANYVNLGGFVHDLVTVSEATHIALSGSPTAEHSWFPGYTWTVATCSSCGVHVGWRFVSMRRKLRPLQFYGLCRNYIEPRNLRDHAPRHVRNGIDLDIIDLIS